MIDKSMGDDVIKMPRRKYSKCGGMYMEGV